MRYAVPPARLTVFPCDWEMKAIPDVYQFTFTSPPLPGDPVGVAIMQDAEIDWPGSTALAAVTSAPPFVAVATTHPADENPPDALHAMLPDSAQPVAPASNVPLLIVGAGGNSGPVGMTILPVG